MKHEKMESLRKRAIFIPFMQAAPAPAEEVADEERLMRGGGVEVMMKGRAQGVMLMFDDDEDDLLLNQPASGKPLQGG
ncbi:hypothetical protein Pmani_005976 [Petrolisthes manimaculis]|uniref:Uncharacterized protein n=1 Tax=Petrolisthes manimaculis TaxID=1843537 RepID=A0AAE1UG68_9EUCA|nr:hypothetical protein Pmani_005976 [Petrolisthes manimaculis]